MTAPTHATLPVSICCANWRAWPQHQNCRGKVRVGAHGTLLPCSCDCHPRPARIPAAASA